VVAERILVLGNVNVDLVMGEVDGWPAVGTEVILPRSEMRAGGSAGNTALALSGLRVPHRLVASVGTDMMGDWLAGCFDAAYSTWIAMDGATTLTVGIVHKGGDRAFFTTTGHLAVAGVKDLLAHVPRAPAGNAYAIISGGFLMPAIERETSALIAALQARGWKVAIDPGWPPAGWTAQTRELMRAWLAEADIALINAEEAKGIAATDTLDAAMASLRPDSASARILVVKSGADGAIVIQRDEAIAIEAPRVEVIDTVGAGDTFNAGFLAVLARGGSLREAGVGGVSAASSAISTFPRRYDI
jgi:sugar/nucleoside kinase (ribokinase family)